jgi:DUF4097 and DUF4098 domain-containing protein YvlB
MMTLNKEKFPDSKKIINIDVSNADVTITGEKGLDKITTSLDGNMSYEYDDEVIYVFDTPHLNTNAGPINSAEKLQKVEIRIPNDVPNLELIAIRTKIGSIALKGITATDATFLAINKGDISLEGIMSKNIKSDSTDGSVVINDCVASENIKASTTGIDNIIIKNTSANNLMCTTKNGDVSVMNNKDDSPINHLTMTTNCGSIYVNGVETSELSINTQNGPVKISNTTTSGLTYISKAGKVDIQTNNKFNKQQTIIN